MLGDTKLLISIVDMATEISVKVLSTFCFYPWVKHFLILNTHI